MTEYLEKLKPEAWPSPCFVTDIALLKKNAAILDSVKTTIIENLGLSYSVYYAGPHGEDLELPEVGVTIPRDEPFSSFWDY